MAAVDGRSHDIVRFADARGGEGAIHESRLRARPHRPARCAKAGSSSRQLVDVIGLAAIERESGHTNKPKVVKKIAWASGG